MWFFEGRSKVKYSEPDMLSQQFRTEWYIIYIVLYAMVKSKWNSKFSALEKYVGYLIVFSIGLKTVSIFMVEWLKQFFSQN